MNLGVISLGSGLDAFQGSDGLARLNVLVNSWAIQTKISTFVSRNVFAITSNQAAYTLGPGGNWNTPQIPLRLTNAGIIFNTSSPPVEVPRGILTDDGFAAIPIKSLTNPYFTDVYFQSTYAAGLATVTLWPVPTDATTQIALYWHDVIGGFADLVTGYLLPNGYERALEYNLAQELIPEYQVPDAVTTKIYARAERALKDVKRGYARLIDLPQDAALVYSPRGGYNILTGTGGGST